MSCNNLINSSLVTPDNLATLAAFGGSRILRNSSREIMPSPFLSKDPHKCWSCPPVKPGSKSMKSVINSARCTATPPAAIATKRSSAVLPSCCNTRFTRSNTLSSVGADKDPVAACGARTRLNSSRDTLLSPSLSNVCHKCFNCSGVIDDSIFVNISAKGSHRTDAPPCARASNKSSGDLPASAKTFWTRAQMSLSTSFGPSASTDVLDGWRFC
mmetsp:Transcript_11667/g.19141  ORF Transcript_11667/g.19141 Transcript_11667/m.19141 type:complete len:214 (+) Transcript_11667:1793-2434(+)